MIAVIHARARSGCRDPVAFVLHVGLPERPGTALQRPHGVDPAAFLPVRVGPQKFTILVSALAQAPQSAPAVAGVFFFERCEGHAEMVGDGGDFIRRDPDIAGRSTAAVAALRARELQPASVPGLWDFFTLFAILCGLQHNGSLRNFLVHSIVVAWGDRQVRFPARISKKPVKMDLTKSASCLI